jgi:hypothetical protein
MKINYSKRILILFLVIFIGVIALDVLYTNKLFDQILSINDKVKQLNISSEKREKELSLKDFILSSKVEREKLDQYFVGAGNAETVKFTKYLEDLAAEVGVDQKKSLDYEAVSEFQSSDVVSALHFRFNVSGHWADVYTFLKLIENLPKVVSLNSVSLTATSGAVSAREAKSGVRLWSADLDFFVVKLKN